MRAHAARLSKPVLTVAATLRRSRIGLTWLAVCLSLAGWFGVGPSRGPNVVFNPRPASAESLAGATGATGRPGKDILQNAPRTKAIEDIRVGERVLGINPLADGPLGAQDEALPDPATWKKVKLRLNEPGYGRLDMTFIQPPEWFTDTGARVGGTVELDLPELGAEGDAEVLSIGPCPPIEPGDGAVVTGTLVHRSTGNLVNVRFEGVDEPDGVTDNHLFFSLDRNDFVEAGHLRRGERIEGAIDGDILRVASVARRPADELVYNLQVNGQHVYHVGSHGALVHNACGHFTKGNYGLPGSGPSHHIATHYGAWGVKFKALFAAADRGIHGMGNRVFLPGHKGPHSAAYHQKVFARLKDALAGKRTPASRASALQAELENIANDLLSGALKTN